MMRSAILAGIGLTLAAASASAADPEAGRAFAVKACARCHVVGPGVGSGTDGAPTFETVANTKDQSETKLTAFLSRPHGRMPDFVLTRREIENVIAYIMTLKTKMK
jgi:mono/diheme cytochrome c family protein